MIDLNFDNHNTLYATHGLHAYAAKCPPQLVRYGIENYTQLGDIVLDPMAGSATTIVESRLLGRHSQGYDIDPLACLIGKVKITEIDNSSITDVLENIQAQTIEDIQKLSNNGKASTDLLFRASQPSFLNKNYWFSPEVSQVLAILSYHIANTSMINEMRNFFWVALSGIILSKVSVANARDIIHSRHHHYNHPTTPDVMSKFTKRVRKMQKQMVSFRELCQHAPAVTARMEAGDARSIPVQNNSVDLVFTSPPYVNALDYTRAHFLAVPWMQPVLGISMEEYKKNGLVYIGSERGSVKKTFEIDKQLSKFDLTRSTLMYLSQYDVRKALLVQRYFVEISKVLSEISRVLRKGHHAIIVVCPSHIRKVEIHTHKMLTELSESTGLILRKEHIRTISSRHRVLPYVRESFGNRMSTEYVLIYRKDV